MKRLFALAVLSSVGSPLLADVGVRIVDYPSRVLRFSPIFITAKITNHGKDPVLVPATNHTESRYLIEKGRTADGLAEFSPYESTGGGSVVWLKPGESWLFRADIGPWSQDPGSYFVRAGVHSTGRCQHQSTGTETFPLKLLEKHTGTTLYECWAGHAASNVVAIEVVEPTAAIDREALDYVRSPDFPISCCGDQKFHLRLQFGAAALLERFPTSHYTYVGALYACTKAPDCLQRLLESQPLHPLTSYARLERELALIETGRTQEVTVSSVQQMNLPGPLKEYLLQESRKPRRSQAAVSKQRR